MSALLDQAWRDLLAVSPPLMHSGFFFLLVASSVTLAVNLFFSLLDGCTGRVPPRVLGEASLTLLSGFVPFILMWVFQWNVVTVSLPVRAPTAWQFATQFFTCLVLGDACHYLTHRALHTPFLRRHIHHVHHDYEGHLFSWIGAQVHPVEAVAINGAIYWPFLVFAHPMVLWFMAVVATVNATVAHSGYDGGVFQLGNWLPFGLTTDDHQLHHDVNATKNFGNVLSVWDRLGGTYGTGGPFKALSIWEVVLNDVKIRRL